MADLDALDKPIAGIRTDAERIGSYWPRADWPADHTVISIFDPTVWVTRFPDHDSYAAELAELILARNAENENVLRYEQEMGIGTAKLMGLDRWGHAATDRINARALAMAGVTLKRADMVVRNAWATVYQSGDWAQPHCHPGVVASVLYMLDPGEDGGRLNGAFRFVDPRVKGCCPEQMGIMSRAGAPELTPGTMMIFPGQTVHMVSPYHGNRPRITLSWDLIPKPAGG
ncbi:hypothetical protein HKCCE3408_02525 [Rhodobacterales bacterium HKCCE3408]|nr:hypothetical protein [Rhodobacterales bacterium HKCCE3408]